MLLVFLYILLQLTLRIFYISLRVERNVLPYCNHLIIACPPSAQYASRHCFCQAFSRCFVPTELEPEAPGVPLPVWAARLQFLQAAVPQHGLSRGRSSATQHNCDLQGHSCLGILLLSQGGKQRKTPLKSNHHVNFDSTGVSSRKSVCQQLGDGVKSDC